MARLACLAAWTCLLGQSAMAQSGAQLLQYSDFGRPDILLTAASIRQSFGDNNVARIEQVTDITGTDRALYPVGDGNISDVVQSGSGNRSFLTQTGNLNRARIEQNGLDNRVDASQTGVGNRLDVLQTGLSNSLLASQIGVGNSITAGQSGGNQANLTETGDNNTITVKQVIGGPNLNINLVGSGFTVTITQ
jgi:hypothetical protein